MTDSQLRQDIIDEFEFDPTFDGEHIGVAVDKNVVSLTGHATSYAQKVAAIAAARRVKGVHAIAENIEVRYPFQAKIADDQIAKRGNGHSQVGCSRPRNHRRACSGWLDHAEWRRQLVLREDRGRGRRS